jgi:hypothetical protein
MLTLPLAETAVTLSLYSPTDPHVTQCYPYDSENFPVYLETSFLKHGNSYPKSGIRNSLSSLNEQ